MGIIARATSFFIGIGQNLPYESMFFSGIGIGDLLVISGVFIDLIKTKTRKGFIAESIRQRGLLILVYSFVVLTLISCLSNSFVRDLKISDIFEAVRPFYYFLLVVFFITRIKRNGADIVVYFVFGILSSAIVSYLESDNRDVSGFVMLWNPNVIGNMISVGIILVSMLFFSGKIVTGCMLATPLLLLSVMTYSKSTWIMVVLGLFACYFSVAYVRQSIRRERGLFMFLIIIALSSLFFVYFDRIFELIKFKLQTTQLGDSAEEGGTVAARWGYVIASFYMAMDNPLFGVGLTNFESAYDDLRGVLGPNYWPSDNPHSAWLYLIACFGLPATIVFLLIFYNFSLRLYMSVPLRGCSRLIYCSTIMMALFISGATQLQLITQHFFWFFFAVVNGISLERNSFSVSDSIRTHSRMAMSLSWKSFETRRPS